MRTRRMNYLSVGDRSFLQNVTYWKVGRTVSKKNIDTSNKNTAPCVSSFLHGKACRRHNNQVQPDVHSLLLTCIPGAPGSTPESKIAMTTPRPSYSGYLVRNCVTPVSFLGSRPQTGKLQSMTPAIFRMPP